jgi:hypothetical protein
MDQTEKVTMIKECVKLARKHIASVEWDNPDIINGLSQELDLAIKATEEEGIIFPVFTEKNFPAWAAETFKSMATKSYYIRMNFWQSVAFVLEAQVQILKKKLSEQKRY